MPKPLFNITRIASSLFKSFPGRRNKLLILELTKKELGMGLVTKAGRIDSFSRLSLRELPDDDLVLRIKNFAGGKNFVKACLILPKAQLIERHLEVPLIEGEEWRQTVRKRIEESLPVSPSEVSHAVKIEKDETRLRVRLLACPLLWLEKFLVLLDRAGVDLEEIISSDQALLWCSLAKVSHSSCLVLNFEDEMIELLFREGTEVVFSRVIHVSDENPIHEIEFALLECLKKPEAVLLLGKIDSEVESILRKTFSVPIEKDSADNVSPAVYGGSFVSRYPSLSLLPQERKVEKRKRETHRRMGELGCISCLLVTTVLFGVGAHGKVYSDYLEKLELAIQPLRSEMKNLEKVTKTLHFLHEREASRWMPLEFLRQLSLGIPSQVVLSEISFDRPGLRLKGTSSSYSGVAEMIQFLNKTELVSSPHLEYARLRKKESKEFFEFEIECPWKDKSLKGTRASKYNGLYDSQRFARRWEDKKRELGNLEAFASKKLLYLAAYERIFQSHPHFENPNDFVSDFVREMGARFESHQLRVLKIEPQGMTPLQIPGAAMMEIKVMIQGEGDMKGLVAFLYEMVSGSVNEIHSLEVVMRFDPREVLSYEIVLGKLIP